MPEELLIILAAEAVLLVFVTAMTLHVGRMDVLKGRSLKRAAGALTRNMRSQGSIGARVRDSMRLTGRWLGIAKTNMLWLSQRLGPIRSARTILRAKVHTPQPAQDGPRRSIRALGVGGVRASEEALTIKPTAIRTSAPCNNELTHNIL
jgi:hypothetical protein